MKPVVATFSRENPCTKKDLWRCFKRSISGFSKVQVDDAHSIIGKNAPRYMEQKGYLVVDRADSGDFYVLTMVGARWLTDGIQKYAKNHPAERADIVFFPSPAAQRRRVRAA